MIRSTEFLINMKPSDIPPWDEFLPFEEQERSTQQFWEEEAKKAWNGVNIAGVHIPGWLYWHTNIWKVFVDGKDKIRRLKTPELRDNEWYFSECYQEAKRLEKMLVMFGTRRFGKALFDNEYVYTPGGPKKIGYIMAGDKIYDESGKLTTVRNVYPQGNKMLYRVYFEDGRDIICCGEHLWKIKVGGNWVVKNTDYILNHPQIQKISIPLTKSVDFPERKLPFNPDTYASLIASYLLGQTSKFFFEDRNNMLYLLSSASQRQAFISSFIKSIKGIETGYDEVEIEVYDSDVLYFVKKMFWASGYYCKYEDQKLIFSNTKTELHFKEAKVFGKYSATCIEVANESKLFLASDFLVTHNSVLIASHIAYHATFMYGSSNSVVGSSAGDLGNIAEYLEYGLDNVPWYFRIPRIGNDFFKTVVFGTRNKDNTRNLWSSINFVNVDMGKTKASQKTAGGTPASFVMDEVGKFDMLGPLNAAIPSFKSMEGSRLVPLICGTGGNIELSKNIETILANPSVYNVYEMDWDKLDKHMENPPWKKRVFSMFAPGHMSYSEFGSKKDSNLSEYLQIPDNKLKKIHIKVTDFEEANTKINNELKRLEESSDKEAYSSFRMSYPVSPDDCFLSTHINEFPVEAAMEHKRELIENGRPSMIVDVFQKENKQLGWKISEKSIAPFPFKGGIFDAAIQIYEPPVSNDFRDYVYTCGLDPYKKNTATTTSLGSFYVYKRRVSLNDPFANRIVASYAARPGDMDDFCRTCEILQEGYGAICLYENADVMYETYLFRKNKDALLLADGRELSGKFINSKSSQTQRLGLSPSPAHQNFLFKLTLAYTRERVILGYDDDGNEIEGLGVKRIDDLELLEEIIQYRPGKNVDRIVAFGHALALARYYDDMNYLPRSSEQKWNEKRHEEKKKKQSIIIPSFTSSFYNPYK